MEINRYRYGGTLEKRISKYLKKFGITRAICTNSFFYIPEGKTVCFTILNYTTDKDLIEFVNNKYDVDITNWYFIFSLLHEVGHHMTVDQLTDEDMAFEIAARNAILPLFGDETEKRNSLYFELPAEDLANRWAINYIENHTQECWDFQRKCFAVMRHIFKKKCFTY